MPLNFSRSARRRAGRRLSRRSRRFPSRKRSRLSKTSGGSTVAGTSRVRVARTVRDYPIWAPKLATRQEMKFVDVNLATYTADTTGTITALNGVIQGGDGLSEREGNRIRVLATIIKGFVAAGSAGVASQATLLIVYDKMPQPIGAAVAPLVTTILETISSNSFMAIAGRDRFTVLARYDYALVGNSTAPATGREYVAINEKIDFNLPSSWDAAVGTLARMLTGTLYAVTVGNLAASGTLAPNFQLTYRTLFADV